MIWYQKMKSDGGRSKRWFRIGWWNRIMKSDDDKPSRWLGIIWRNRTIAKLDAGNAWRSNWKGIDWITIGWCLNWEEDDDRHRKDDDIGKMGIGIRWWLGWEKMIGIRRMMISEGWGLTSDDVHQMLIGRWNVLRWRCWLDHNRMMLETCSWIDVRGCSQKGRGCSLKNRDIMRNNNMRIGHWAPGAKVRQVRSRVRRCARCDSGLSYTLL